MTAASDTVIRISTAIRMSVVLAFLLGMPILALPRVQELLLGAQSADTRAATAAGSESDPRTAVDVGGQASSAAGSDNLLAATDAPPDSSPTLLLVEPAQPSAPVAPRAETGASEIEQLRQRFEQLGATYLALERVGVDGARFRFTCNLPLRAGSPYQQRFQGVSADPATAMRRVLADVERWSVAGGAQTLGRPRVKLR